VFHPEGELADAAAADRARIPYGLVGLSTVAMETIAESHPALDRWFHIGRTSDA
jgi:L-lactate dehydrogenase (cytochrome)